MSARTTTAERQRSAPAWRGGFGRLWAAAVVSRVGDGLRGAALPLLVSLVTAAGFLPWLLFGVLFAGAVVALLPAVAKPGSGSISFDLPRERGDVD